MSAHGPATLAELPLTPEGVLALRRRFQIG